MNTPTDSYSKPIVWYTDDSDPHKAGQGLAYAPILDSKLKDINLTFWLMSPAEQTAILYILQNLQPKVSIEIGTRFGGSLQVLSHFSSKVYSLDIDPEVPNRLANKYPNVEYIIGDSSKTLPLLLQKLQDDKAEVGFILVDGDHSTQGVKADIDNLLKFKPIVPLYIVMHDSLNPVCREGLKLANWENCPFVHQVELDYISGSINQSRALEGEIWGGLALATLLPVPRTGRFEITGRSSMMLKQVSPKYRRLMLMKRIKASLKYHFNRFK